MNVPPRRIVWAALHQPQMIEPLREALRVPLGLTQFIEQGTRAIFIQTHRQREMWRKVAMLVLPDRTEQATSNFK